jgi:hypothetical protein
VRSEQSALGEENACAGSRLPAEDSLAGLGCAPCGTERMNGEGPRFDLEELSRWIVGE